MTAPNVVSIHILTTDDLTVFDGAAQREAIRKQYEADPASMRSHVGPEILDAVLDRYIRVNDRAGKPSDSVPFAGRATVALMKLSTVNSDLHLGDDEIDTLVSALRAHSAPEPWKFLDKRPVWSLAVAAFGRTFNQAPQFNMRPAVTFHTNVVDTQVNLAQYRTVTIDRERLRKNWFHDEPGIDGRVHAFLTAIINARPAGTPKRRTKPNVHTTTDNRPPSPLNGNTSVEAVVKNVTDWLLN